MWGSQVGCRDLEEGEMGLGKDRLVTDGETVQIIKYISNKLDFSLLEKRIKNTENQKTKSRT
jgi:hypothetical protein